MKYAGLGLAGGLFYAAPIGAGITGASYFAVLPFAGLFFLWVLVMRVEPFRDGAGFILPTIMLHLALASVCLGFGQALRALFGIEARVPLTPWLVLGLGALALGRILWQPRREAETEALLETALKKLDAFADEAAEILDREPDLPLNHPTPAEAAALAAAFGALDGLPPEAAAEPELRRILLPLATEVRPHILLKAVLDRARRTTARRDRFAALILAADPALAPRQEERGMAAVFELIVAAADTVALAQFLQWGDALLDEVPTAWTSFPTVGRLLDMSGQIAGREAALADGLVTLAHRLEDIELDLSDD